MQPQQSGDPYGFIMNSPARPPKQPLAMKARILVVGGGLILLIIIFVIVSSLLSSGQKAQRDIYVQLAQKQTEMIRISTIGSKKAKTLQAKSYAITTRVSLESSQKQTTALITKRGLKEKNLNKSLALSKNVKVDTELETAEKNNRFDETFMKIMETQLSDYQKLLNQAASGASANERKSLEAAFSQVAVLQKKPTSTPPPITSELPDIKDEESEEDFIEEESLEDEEL
jgi:hypothetical protein